MKIRRKLALALGLAAGAVVAMVATGRTGKRTKQYISGKYNEPKTNFIYQDDDSETFYI